MSLSSGRDEEVVERRRMQVVQLPKAKIHKRGALLLLVCFRFYPNIISLKWNGSSHYRRHHFPEITYCSAGNRINTQAIYCAKPLASQLNQKPHRTNNNSSNCSNVSDLTEWLLRTTIIKDSKSVCANADTASDSENEPVSSWWSEE